MQIGARIARAQLNGLGRSRRQIVVGPLVGMLHDDDAWFLSTMLAAEPGTPFDPDEVRESLVIVRKAFAAEGRWLSAELIEEANPGLAEELESNGMTIVSRPPLLVVEPEDLVQPSLPAGVTVQVIGSDADQAEANVVSADAYEAEEVGFTYQPVLGDGGAVLVRVDGVAAATAAWTAVADGVTEVAGVGTIHTHRRQGLAGIATAYATQVAFEQAGASLAWLTPGDDGADRVYRRVGYAPQATAVHLGDPGGHLADLR
ncbi:GNAT family N-acetyltransferase [Kribbella antibiotica]|uniref:GNAT family N-acetyltransferase n=1 Tax=Kribbella antibiotica TaxID=190195 RepID=A0A4R4YNW8_9ACTN|nr:GNAT family N-acetyltransferase [Kribbella antibiotica]TDD45212.1 GNAT family N-acetyltransferase [Kribbella antibiotica]